MVRCCHIFHHHDHDYRSFVQIWRRVPRERSTFDEGLLGSTTGYFWRRYAHPDRNVSCTQRLHGLLLTFALPSFAYCIKVYIQNMFSDDKTETQSSAGLPSYTNSVRTRSARAVYRRVRKVLWLQWRGITIVVFILVDVIFFSVVFIWLNALTSHAKENVEELLPFLVCLMKNPEKPDPCFPLGQDLAINKSTVIAILMMLSIAGIQVFILLARGSMFVGWYELFKSKFSKNREFVSLDAKHLAEVQQNYELKHFDNEGLKSPESALTSPPEIAGYGNFRSDTPDYFSKETQREYKSPTLSFSTPRPPSRAAHVDWDPRATHARGGLGFHPPADKETKI
jgi:hypothetical protein